MLKGIAAHYVMQAEDRVALMSRQREVLAELVAGLLERGPRRCWSGRSPTTGAPPLTTQDGCASWSTRWRR